MWACRRGPENGDIARKAKRPKRSHREDRLFDSSTELPSKEEPVNHPSNRYRAAVQLNLHAVKIRHGGLILLDRTPIRSAYQYGWTVPEIAAETDLSLRYIQRVLLGD